jgi:hypothetical protein
MDSEDLLRYHVIMLVGQLVEALSYMSGGHGFVSRWFRCNF